MADAPTDDTINVAWKGPSKVRPGETLHLVVAWWLEEPERTGQVGSLAGAEWFGRGARKEGEGPGLDLCIQRPGKLTLAPPIDSTKISRRQLRFTQQKDGTVGVERTGRRALLHNGVQVEECVVQAGDTLMLEDAVVLLVESRPEKMPGLRAYKGPFEFGQPDPFGIVGETPIVWRMRDLLAAVAEQHFHVLIQGPSGSGKELAARAIHELSPHATGQYVTRNAATIPASLADAEIFGTAKDYPNVGGPERSGLIAAAHKGTCFLDEIGELPHESQARLLRVLDTVGEYTRLGEVQMRRSDFRLVAATNRPVADLKHDLVGRLRSRVAVPGLQQRRGDIPLLAQHLLRLMAEASPTVRRFMVAGASGPAVMEPRLVERLLRHPYTLHTRELERLLSVSVATSPGTYLALTPEVEEAMEASDEPDDSDDDEPEVTSARVAKQLREARQVREAIEAAEGNMSRAADILGMNRTRLYRLMKRYGLTP